MGGPACLDHPYQPYPTPPHGAAGRGTARTHPHAGAPPPARLEMRQRSCPGSHPGTPTLSLCGHAGAPPPPFSTARRHPRGFEGVHHTDIFTHNMYCIGPAAHLYIYSCMYRAFYTTACGATKKRHWTIVTWTPDRLKARRRWDGPWREGRRACGHGRCGAVRCGVVGGTLGAVLVAPSLNDLLGSDIVLHASSAPHGRQQRGRLPAPRRGPDYI